MLYTDQTTHIEHPATVIQTNCPKCLADAAAELRRMGMNPEAIRDAFAPRTVEQEHAEEHFDDICMDCPLCVAEWREIGGKA